MHATKASCLCGEVTLSAQGAPLRVGLCHCKDCQKHHGAAFYAAAIFASQQVAVSGPTHSYKGRHFCPRCGSSVFAESGDEIEIHLGALDNPDSFVPTYEGWTTQRMKWVSAFAEMIQHPRGRED